MKWDEIQHGCHCLLVKQADQTAIMEEMTNFWRGFASDVLPLTPADVWDHLLIDVRGVDGGISIYPQHSAKPPFQVPWAHLDLHQLGFDYEALSEIDLEEGSRPAAIDLSYASMLVDAAQKASLAALVRRSKVRLCFVAYSEDRMPPFFQQEV